MTKVELFVGLKIPDTTAITAFHTIEKMGYSIKKLRREIYYSFEINSDQKRFEEKVAKVDILVNANKNKFSFKIEKDEGAIYILVKDRDDRFEGLLHTLQNRLGFTEIESIQKGVLWTIYGADDTIAKEIADKLLHNENYQEAYILNTSS